MQTRNLCILQPNPEPYMEVFDTEGFPFADSPQAGAMDRPYWKLLSRDARTSSADVRSSSSTDALLGGLSVP